MTQCLRVQRSTAVCYCIYCYVSYRAVCHNHKNIYFCRRTIRVFTLISTGYTCSSSTSPFSAWRKEIGMFQLFLYPFHYSPLHLCTKTQQFCAIKYLLLLVVPGAAVSAERGPTALARCLALPLFLSPLHAFACRPTIQHINNYVTWKKSYKSWPNRTTPGPEPSAQIQRDPPGALFVFRHTKNARPLSSGLPSLYTHRILRAPTLILFVFYVCTMCFVFFFSFTSEHDVCQICDHLYSWTLVGQVITWESATTTTTTITAASSS